MLQDVYTFCNNLSRVCNIGFMESKIRGGTRVIGEYYTNSGQLLTMILNVLEKKVEVRVYDGMRRLIYSKDSSTSISKNMQVYNFIERSLNM